MTGSLHRRSLLGGASALAGSLALGGLTACSTQPSGPTKPASQNAAGVIPPDVVKYAGVKPDLPGNGTGVADGIFAYPKDPPKLFTSPPLSGVQVKGMTLSYGTFLPVEKNPFWQELNTRTGAELTLNAVPSGDYGTKLATVLAGNDLPDITFLTAAGVPRLPDMLKAKFNDLQKFLSGSASKNFPYLANLPTYAWKACMYAGGLYGIPIVRSTVDGIMFARVDLLEKAGLSHEVGSLDEFTELCKKITDPNAKRWAIGGLGIFPYAQQMYGLPNKWHYEAGTLTAAFETEGYLKALTYAAEMNKAGVLHPDSFSPNLQYKDLFKAGQAVMILDGQSAWPGYVPGQTGVDPATKVGAVIPPGVDGAKATASASRGVGGMSILKKADDARITDLLTYLNYLAAPFGTEEFRFLNFGIEGTTWKPGASGDPVVMPNSSQYLGVTKQYLADCERPIYIPEHQEVVKAYHSALLALSALGVSDPTVGLTSATESSTQDVEGQKRSDLNNDIIAGRKPITAFSDYVKTWQAGVGKKIKDEYLAALSSSSPSPS